MKSMILAVVVAALLQRALREVARGLDELRIVHGHERLQRRVGALAADAADLAARAR